jgi:hypothetical protein
MADAATPPTPAEPEHPLAARLKSAIRAHPVLRDEKKLHVKVVNGAVRLEGSVFTRDTYRQLLDLMSRFPGSDEVTILVETDVGPPQPRTLEGQVPQVSPGAGATKLSYSVSHLPKKT